MSAPGDAWAPQSVAAVQDAVREAAETRAPIRIAGGSGWLDGGWPVDRDARVMHLDGLRGITQYTPGDLTLTARSGTPLREIAEATAAEGQWLALDPFSAAEDGGTIGATIATASAGPLAHALGLPRDIVLGMEVVTGDGEVVRAGGRVVKNVAGYDITRLMTGAWGTLGVITEVSVRLRARPEVDRTLAITIAEPAGSAANTVTTLRRAALAPLAAELLNPALAARLGVTATGSPVLLLRLGGNRERVDSEEAEASAIGPTAVIGADVWRALRHCEASTPGAVVVRWSQLPSLADATWRHAVACCAGCPDALIHASIGRGVVRAIIPSGHAAALAHVVRTDTQSAGHGRFEGRRIAERLPSSLWSTEAAPPDPARLSRRVRQAFDPWHILNPGILGEGARDVMGSP